MWEGVENGELNVSKTAVSSTSTFKRLKYSKTIALSYSQQNRVLLDTMDLEKGATLYTELTQQLAH